MDAAKAGAGKVRIVASQNRGKSESWQNRIVAGHCRAMRQLGRGKTLLRVGSAPITDEQLF